jgi:hypothetical protein
VRIQVFPGGRDVVIYSSVVKCVKFACSCSGIPVQQCIMLAGSYTKLQYSNKTLGVLCDFLERL